MLVNRPQTRHTRTMSPTLLQQGRRYRVIEPFIDFDGQLHPIGETWTFLGTSFLPYDDGLSVFVDRAGQKRQIRLQWREEAQGEIIDHLDRYLAPAD
jgi:hypothetical protein